MSSLQYADELELKEQNNSSIDKDIEWIRSISLEDFFLEIPYRFGSSSSQNRTPRQIFSSWKRISKFKEQNSTEYTFSLYVKKLIDGKDNEILKTYYLKIDELYKNICKHHQNSISIMLITEMISVHLFYGHSANVECYYGMMIGLMIGRLISGDKSVINLHSMKFIENFLHLDMHANKISEAYKQIEPILAHVKTGTISQQHIYTYTEHNPPNFSTF